MSKTNIGMNKPSAVGQVLRQQEWGKKTRKTVDKPPKKRKK